MSKLLSQFVHRLLSVLMNDLFHSFNDVIMRLLSCINEAVGISIGFVHRDGSHRKKTDGGRQ